MSEDEGEPTIVIDNGSYLCQAGLSWDKTCRSVFPAVVGRQLRGLPEDSQRPIETFVGDRARAYREVLALRCPIQHGVIQHWDDMEILWNFIFDSELRISSKNRDVLLTEHVFNPKKVREKMVEVMFEKFRTSGVFVHVEGVLAALASGRESAMTVGIGKEIIQVLPVINGNFIKDAGFKAELGGSDITELLGKMLSQKGYSLLPEETINDMKHALCYIAVDYENEIIQSEKLATDEERFELPDGRMFKVGKEKFIAPEVLFNPKLSEKHIIPLPEAVKASIDKCESSVHETLYSNIIMHGSSTMFKNMDKRLNKELNALTSSGSQVKVIRPPEARSSVWLGGSVVAEVSSFQDSKVTRQEYDECGPGVIHAKTLIMP